MTEKARADRWLWAVRFFKTRSGAAKECDLGRVTRDGHAVKPSTSLKPGDVLEIPFPEGPGRRTVRVKSLIELRVGAPLARECYEDLTEPAVYEALKEALRNRHDAGTRPTKKERRQIGRIRGFFE